MTFLSPGGCCCSCRWPLWPPRTSSSTAAAAATPSASPRLPMLERLVPRRPGWRRHLPAVLALRPRPAGAGRRPPRGGHPRAPRERDRGRRHRRLQLDAGHRRRAHRLEPPRTPRPLRQGPPRGVQRRRRAFSAPPTSARLRRPTGRSAALEGSPSARAPPSARACSPRSTRSRQPPAGREEEGPGPPWCSSPTAPTPSAARPRRPPRPRRRRGCRSRRSPTARPRARSRSTGS